MKLRLAILTLILLALLPISVLARPKVSTQESRLALAPTADDLVVIGQNDKSGSPTQVLTFDFRITSTTTDTYKINIIMVSDNGIPISAFIPTKQNVLVLPSTPGTFSVQVTLPASATNGQFSTVSVQATGGGGQVLSQLISARVAVAAGTTTPTTTPGPICNGGGRTRNDGYEPDNSLLEARPIEIDVPQQHALCPVGDEDWMTFGGLEGKVYTIDVSQAEAGLDPSLTLYDSDGNQLAYNDDFPRNNDPTDIKPRIQSWRAPRNGQYYIKVRDAAGRGFNNGLYTIELISESYGPTPTLIAELCADLYEPDGLPQEATLMVTGETHQIHKLCPKGDADWVTFFADSSKEYSLFTSNLSVGADTVLVLTDRDGVSILQFNDDFGNSLESRVDFRVPVDGFYYAQIKNVGDIGNQFISYRLTFQISANANSGAPSQPTVAPGTTPTATLPNGTPTTTLTPGTTTPTTTPDPDETTTATETPYDTSQKLPNYVTDRAGTFADQAFARVWQRADGPVASGQATRTWLWGPQSGRARVEVYDQSPGGLRQVQYFDKSRMEITNFGADRSSEWYVTNGLLAKELISGQIQIGDGATVQRGAAQISLAGDLDDKRGPTYASLSGVLGAVGDRSGQYATQTLDRAGAVGTYDGPQRDAAKLVTFIPQTGHNIAGVFWDFLNRRGPISIDGRVTDGLVMNWVFALGYPITEPYWTRVRVGGAEQDVLVQAFERRVLTYTPGNPAAWQVEMGNVGQHYELWRYGK